MKTNELIAALRRMKVETGSLICFGCGHEHNCNTRGCALIREAADRLEQYAHEIEASVNDMKQIGRGYDSCMFCAHCCVDGEPLYRKNEPYLAFCKTCDSDNCCFEWRGVVDNSEVPKDETD